MNFAKKPSAAEASVIQVFDMLSSAGIPTSTIERLIDQSNKMEAILQDCIVKALAEADKNPSVHERLFLKSAFFGGMGVAAEARAKSSELSLRVSLDALSRRS